MLKDRLMRGLINAVPYRAKSAVIDSVIRNINLVPKRRKDNLLDNIPGVAILARGGLGDHVVAARFIRDLFAVTGPFEFDLFTSRLGPSGWIYKAIPQIRRMYSEHVMWNEYYRDYALALDVTQYVNVPHTDWLAVSELNPKLAQIVEHIDRYRGRIEPCVNNHPYLDGHLGRIAVFHNRCRRDYLQYIAKIPYGGDRFELPVSPDALDRFGLQSEPYITVHNGFEVDSDQARVSSTKVYPHFTTLVKRIKQRFPTLKIVQLGASTSRLIDGVDLDLISKTKMDEVAAVLQGSRFHIDNESGLVHIARCFETPSGVIFGPTDADYFGYPDNVNVKPEFCGNCWWHSRDWMATCVRGFAEPRCLSTRSPDDIFEAFLPKLQQVLGADPRPLADNSTAAAS